MKDTNLKKSDLITGLEGIEDVTELCIDYDHISISVNRFEELIKKEAQIEILENIYFNHSSYSMHDKAAIIFGPIPEKSDEDA